MRSAVVFALLLLAPPARSETVLEFVGGCRESELGPCFERIRSELDRLKSSQQGRAFCLPRAWGATMFESTSYPVSVLEHIRLGMSAARFGDAGRSADDMMVQIVATVYPCER